MSCAARRLCAGFPPPRILLRFRPGRHRSPERLRLLRLVWVRSGPIDLQLLELAAAELRLREHPANGLLDDPLGEARAHLRRRDRLQAPRISAVPPVGLHFFLAARQTDALRVGDDDEIAGVEMRRPAGPMLARQNPSHVARQTSQNLVRGVHDEPLVANIRGANQRGTRTHFKTSAMTKKRRYPAESASGTAIRRRRA